MIRLLRLGIALAVLWMLYWGAAGYALKHSVAGWFTAQETRGWQADYADLSLGGFPIRHDLVLTGPALADPQNGTAWQADGLTLSSPAIWPGWQSWRFPDTAQRFSYFDQTVVLRADDMQADLHLRPGRALELERLGLTAGGWSLSSDAGEIMGASDLTLSMDQGAQPEVYAFQAQAQRFTPGLGLRSLGGSQPALPASFETLTLQMQVTFDRPWDRSALEDSRPQPRQIDLRLLDVHWGPLRLKAAGEVTVDSQGIPDGSLSIQAENWRNMLVMAQTSGVLPPQAFGPAERVLGLLAGLNGNAETLDVTLGFQNGFVTLGPLPLGPAPRIVLR